MSECEHGLPCPCLACSRPCRKKVGWITGDVYCATHGRDKGWPCVGYMHEPQRPIPWHMGDDGEALCHTHDASCAFGNPTCPAFGES